MSNIEIMTLPQFIHTVVLPDQIANLTKESHNILQLQTTIAFKMNHGAISYTVQDRNHVLMCYSQTLERKS